MKKKVIFSDTAFFRSALLLCLVFFVAYSVLSIVRHLHYDSFGYDLGINTQVVWRYSEFKAPLSTIGPFPDKTKLAAHIEIIYLLIAPFYWIWSSAKMLLLVEAFFMCASGMAIFLLARRKQLKPLLTLSMLITYLMFYGVQNAMWFDVHSATFAAGFLAWFLYFLDSKRAKLAILFFLLAITAKENIALITFFIGITYFIRRHDKLTLTIIISSIVYLIFVYFIYFPIIINQTYLYQNSHGLLSNLNPLSMIDSSEKRDSIFYTLASFGFIPLLTPLLLLAAFSDFATYFILASDLTASHGIYMHYRVTLAPLLAWATIFTISKVKKLNTTYIAIYLILCTLSIQYVLHLPLSYLTKSWFWTEPSGVQHIDTLKEKLSPKDSVVAQNNIVPHISRRDKIYTLYPEKKEFGDNSPCGEKECDWFRWFDHPTYLFVDTSPEWDARHLLIDREKFIQGISNLEKAGAIRKEKTDGTASIYRIIKQP